MHEQEILEILLDFANTLEAAAVNLKHRIAELAGVEGAAVKETTFTSLTFGAETGARIGEYGVAYRANNIESKWNTAHNVLKQNKATIANRYHGEGYVFAYWLYGEGKIYRQKLKGSKSG